MHDIWNPWVRLREMVRVAKIAICIFDLPLVRDKSGSDIYKQNQV